MREFLCSIKTFVRLKVKKVIHCVRGMGGPVQIASWKCNFSICLDIQVYYLDFKAITILLVLYALLPSISSFFYHTTTPEK